MAKRGKIKKKNLEEIKTKYEQEVRKTLDGLRYNMFLKYLEICEEDDLNHVLFEVLDDRELTLDEIDLLHPLLKEARKQLSDVPYDVYKEVLLGEFADGIFDLDPE